MGKAGVPLVVIIRYADKATGGDPEKEDPAPLEWATELTAPPACLYDARTARGEQAIATLKAENIETVELPLLPEKPSLPLGWLLSAFARDKMDAQAKDIVESGRVNRILRWIH